MLPHNISLRLSATWWLVFIPQFQSLTENKEMGDRDLVAVMLCKEDVKAQLSFGSCGSSYSNWIEDVSCTSFLLEAPFQFNFQPNHSPRGNRENLEELNQGLVPLSN